MASSKKNVYFFGAGKADGRAEWKELLGGKGANLAEMTNLGIVVPAGFTITTEVCTYYYDHEKSYPDELKDAVNGALADGGMGVSGSDSATVLAPLFRFDGALHTPVLTAVTSALLLSCGGTPDGGTWLISLEDSTITVAQAGDEWCGLSQGERDFFLSSSNSFGRLIRARPIASICCSPPESVPAVCERRSARRGKSACMRSRSFATSVSRRA